MSRSPRPSGRAMVSLSLDAEKRPFGIPPEGPFHAQILEAATRIELVNNGFAAPAELVIQAHLGRVRFSPTTGNDAENQPYAARFRQVHAD